MIYVLTVQCTVQALQGGKRGMGGDGTHDMRSNCAVHCAGTAVKGMGEGMGEKHARYGIDNS